MYFSVESVQLLLIEGHITMIDIVKR